LDLSFIKREVDPELILEKLIDGVCATNKLIGIGLDSITDDKRQELILTYEKLVYEEAKELQHAVDTKDKVEFLDAVVDTLVVGCYYLLLKGEQYSNLTYLEQDQTLEDYTKWFLNEINSNEVDTSELFFLASEIFFKSDVKYESAVETVLQSNLSKFPTHEELNDQYDSANTWFDKQGLIDWQCKRIEDKGRYTGVHCKKVVDSEGEERLTFWATHDNGEEKLKYVKPITFTEPNFSACFKL
tara:strand:- start:230 stop:958 length:729 start_codon:yes stop_codon:yes gene_type:complete